MTPVYNSKVMEPRRHIAHIRRNHIDFYVKSYVSMILCGERDWQVESKVFPINNIFHHLYFNYDHIKY